MLKDLDHTLSELLFNTGKQIRFILPVWVLIVKGFGTLPFIAALLIYGKYSSAVSLVFVSASLGIFVEVVLKRVLKRHRPRYMLQQIMGFSFPSTHAFVTSFCLLITSGLGLPLTIMYMLAAYMLLVCYSRVAFGYHYLSDVIGGTLLASLIFAAVYLVSFL